MWSDEQRQEARPSRRWTASAPAKVILFGEHAVNRGQVAVAAAVDLRATCTVRARGDDRFVLRVGDRAHDLSRAELELLRRAVDEARARADADSIQRLVGSTFFAPACYVLALFLTRHDLPGLEIAWRSAIPIGSGLGSGAAASSALVLALCAAAGVTMPAEERAHLAWQGDVVAHGGVASGLDSAATTLGGVVRYTVAGGPAPLQVGADLPIVIGDTGVRANTAEINGRVRAWLAANPAGQALFPAMGTLAERALAALAAGDLRQVGVLMDRNQDLLEQLGVSCPEIDRLIEAARGAGALGAKLSGSGGGGIIIALTTAQREAAVARAIEAAGGAALAVRAAAPGASLDGTAR